MKRREMLKGLAAAPFISVIDADTGETIHEEVVNVDTSAGGTVTITLSDTVSTDRVKIINRGEGEVIIEP